VGKSEPTADNSGDGAFVLEIHALAGKARATFTQLAQQLVKGYARGGLPSEQKVVS
jgi:hypothetical protein